MKQQSLASQSVFEKYGQKSRRELFLNEMEQVVPWPGLETMVRPHDAMAATGGNLWACRSCSGRTSCSSDSTCRTGVEELLYESPAFRRFAGVDLGVAPAPDETAVLRFRHLLEKHDLGGLMLDTGNVRLETKGIKIRTGTIVDATIIHARKYAPSISGTKHLVSILALTPTR